MGMDKFKKMTFEEVYDVLEKSKGLAEKLEESEDEKIGLEKLLNNKEQEVYEVLEKADELDRKLKESEKARGEVQERFMKAERGVNDALKKVGRLEGILNESVENRQKAEGHLIRANEEISNLHDVIDEKRLEVHKAQVILKKIKELMGGHTGEETDEVEAEGGEAEENTPSSH